MTQQLRMYVCHGPICGRQARPIWQALTTELQTQDVVERCELIVSGCQGRCEHGPNINLYPNLTKYAYLTPDDARRIVREHVSEGRPVGDLVFEDAW